MPEARVVFVGTLVVERSYPYPLDLRNPFGKPKTEPKRGAKDKDKGKLRCRLSPVRTIPAILPVFSYF